MLIYSGDALKIDVITIKQFLIKYILPDNSRYIYYAAFLEAFFLFYWIYWGGWHWLWKHFQFAYLEHILCVECSWFLELTHFPNTSIICPRCPRWLTSASMLSNSSLKCCQNMVHSSLTGNGLLAHSYKSRKKSDNLIFKL